MSKRIQIYTKLKEKEKGNITDGELKKETDEIYGAPRLSSRLLK